MESVTTQRVNGFRLPHTIRNRQGEELIFEGLEPGPNGTRLRVRNAVAPGAGPPMHVHWQQDECLEVVEGRMGHQVSGGPERFAGPGESVTFPAGTPHRFWNAGSDTLRCTGWIDPPHSIVYFLDGLYRATDAGTDGRPEPFASARLAWRYRHEYDLPEIPAFVRRVVFPLTVALGRLTGRYRGVDPGPEPLPPRRG